MKEQRWRMVEDPNGEPVPTILPARGTALWKENLTDQYERIVNQQQAAVGGSLMDGALCDALLESDD